MTPEVWIVTWTAAGVLTGQTLWEAGIRVARWIREPLDGPEAQLRRVARHLDHTRVRGSDFLNPAPVQTVDSMTPEEQAQSSRYSATDSND